MNQYISFETIRCLHNFFVHIYTSIYTHNMCVCVNNCKLYLNLKKCYCSSIQKNSKLKA